MLPFRSDVLAMHGYVPGEQPTRTDVVKLNTNENPYQCSPAVKAAIGRVLQGGLQRYPDPLASAFREAAAQLHRDEVPGLTPDWILCGNGSDDVLTILVRSFVNPGEHLRFSRPSYVLYQELAAIQGAKCHVVDYADDWSLGADFTKHCDKLRLALVANPNSPSGTMIEPEEIARIAAALPCPLVVDEAYADFAPRNCLPLVAADERVIVTRTLSKSYALAGLRFGYAVAQPQVIEQLRKVKDSYNCDGLSIAGAVAALGDREWFVRHRDLVLATRTRLTERLRGLGFSCLDSQANFIWCRHATADSRAIYERLKDQGILVRYMNYPGWGDGLRITVGSDAQVDLLLAKLPGIVA